MENTKSLCSECLNKLSLNKLILFQHRYWFEFVPHASFAIFIHTTVELTSVSSYGDGVCIGPA